MVAVQMFVFAGYKGEKGQNKKNISWSTGEYMKSQINDEIREEISFHDEISFHNFAPKL